MPRQVYPQVLKKFCKVCHDSGKEESLYTSHFIRETRDPNSRVVCPTLLSLECRYCFKKGHTRNYCPTLKNGRPQITQPTLRTEERTESSRKPQVQRNIYMILDDDEEKEEKEEKEDFPQLISLKTHDNFKEPKSKIVSLCLSCIYTSCIYTSCIF
jgi:hypothetical protein